MKLQELFTNPYDITWTRSRGEYLATFTTERESKVTVHFTGFRYAWNVEFQTEYKDPKTGHYQRTFLKTGLGDAPRIFATILVAIQEFIKNYNPKYLWFTASNKEPSRIKLYQTMVNKLAKQQFDVIDDPSQDPSLPGIIKVEMLRSTASKCFVLKNRNYKDYVPEVAIDNVQGAGAVPDNQNVDYLGLRVQMKPSVFLKLAAKLGTPQSAGELADYIKQGGAIGAPFLDISIPDEWFDDALDYDKPARIVGHEGRNRMIAVQKVEGDNPVEVHLFFRGGLRRRHLTPEIIERLQYNAKGIYNQDKNLVLDSTLFRLENKKPLNELFDKPYEFKQKDKNTYRFRTSANVEYSVTCHDEHFFDHQQNKWIAALLVEFGLVTPDRGIETSIAKTGDAFNVFATVVEIIKQHLIQNSKIDRIMFSAHKGDPSRVKLYNSFMKLIPQFLSGFKLEKIIDDPDYSYRLYVLKHKNVEDTQ